MKNKYISYWVHSRFFQPVAPWLSTHVFYPKIPSPLFCAFLNLKPLDYSFSLLSPLSSLLSLPFSLFPLLSSLPSPPSLPRHPDSPRPVGWAHARRRARPARRGAPAPHAGGLPLRRPGRHWRQGTQVSWRGGHRSVMRARFGRVVIGLKRNSLFRRMIQFHYAVILIWSSWGTENTVQCLTLTSPLQVSRVLSRPLGWRLMYARLITRCCARQLGDRWAARYILRGVGYSRMDNIFRAST